MRGAQLTPSHFAGGSAGLHCFVRLYRQIIGRQAPSSHFVLLQDTEPYRAGAPHAHDDHRGPSGRRHRARALQRHLTSIRVRSRRPSPTLGRAANTGLSVRGPGKGYAQPSFSKGQTRRTGRSVRRNYSPTSIPLSPQCAHGVAHRAPLASRLPALRQPTPLRNQHDSKDGPSASSERRCHRA